MLVILFVALSLALINYRNVKHGGVVSAKNTINPNPRETDDAMIVENTHNWISNKSPQRKIVKPLFTQNEKQNNSNINSLLGENSNYGSGTVLKRKDDLSTVQIMRKEYDHSNEKTSTDRRASVVIFDKSNTGAAILSASSFSKDSHDYSPVDISALEEVLKRDDFLNHCPTDNDFLLGVNKRCYKLFIPDTVGHSREEKCQMFSSELLQLTSDLDVFAIKKLYKSLSKVKHFYIFAGFKCLDQHTCIDLKTNGIIEFSIKVEKLPCFGVYSLADAEWHCIEEDISGNTKLPFICEKRDTYTMLECKKHDHIRLIDNKCYNKRVYTNPYSRNVGDQICADYAMHLPVIDDNLKQRAISKQMSHFESNLWLGLRCKVGETLSTCKWGNNQPLSYNNFGTSINSISAGECVYLDKKTLQWIATDCSTKFYILCQSDE
uniref:C-type lectin domain-containing protein n=1 Tax=Rhabditophanes sp. KR3021 TaxID=114890 RepID=A0AC35TMH9_9BILA